MALSVIVGIDGNDAGNAGMPARRKQQGDRAANRDPRQRGVLDSLLIEKLADDIDKERRGVIRRGDVRPAVSRVIEGIDRESLGKLRNEFLENIELRAQRVQQYQRRSIAGLHIT